MYLPPQKKNTLNYLQRLSLRHQLSGSRAIRSPSFTLDLGKGGLQNLSADAAIADDQVLSTGPQHTMDLPNHGAAPLPHQLTVGLLKEEKSSRQSRKNINCIKKGNQWEARI